MGNPWEGIWRRGGKQRSNGEEHRQDATGVFVAPDLNKVQLKY